MKAKIQSTPLLIVLVVCGAQVLTLMGIFTFPSLMPEFIEIWRLSNTEAGWIAGISLGGYALSVPILVTLTDRIDARLIHMAGASLAALSLIGFAWLAEGFWSALILRLISGVALAATYMPGLRVLIDRYQGPKQARALSFYTASFSLGTAVSYFYSGEIGAALGWRWTFAIAGVGAAFAVFLIALASSYKKPDRAAEESSIFDFRPVFRNKEAMSYVLAYGVHSWELFAMRAWLVAFLVYSISLQPAGANPWPAPTIVATLGALVAMLTSVGGNELADIYGRRRMVTIYLLSAGLMAMFIGFLPALPYWLLALLTLVYAALVQLDSAALTAGTVMAAETGRRGATLGVHALSGFGAGAIGPLVVGVVLDASGGGETALSWGFGFMSMGALALLGPLAFVFLRSSK